jgi:hypothetical protein
MLMDTTRNYPDKTSGVRNVAEKLRFWGPRTRPRASSGAAAGEASDRASSDSSKLARPRGKPFSRRADWHTVALVGASVAAGAVVGAGVALLMAPQSGAHTRLALRSQLRRRRPWRHSPWEQLGEELSSAAQRRNQRIQAARLARISEGL